MVGFHVARQVTSGGLNFSTNLTSCFALMDRLVVGETLVGGEALVTMWTLVLLGVDSVSTALPIVLLDCPTVSNGHPA